MPCIQIHSDGLYFPIPWCQVFCFAALQRAPIWTCHHWLFFPTHLLAEQMFCTCQKASIIVVSHRFVTWTKIQNWTLKTCWVLVGSWQKMELSHLILPKGSDAPKKICFSLYKSTGKRSTIWRISFSLPVMPDEERKKLGIFKCLTHYCSLRNSYCYYVISDLWKGTT